MNYLTCKYEVIVSVSCVGYCSVDIKVTSRYTLSDEAEGYGEVEGWGVSRRYVGQLGAGLRSSPALTRTPRCP